MSEQPTIPGVATVVGVLSTVFAGTFFLGALLHLGGRIPLGVAIVDEPRILPATIVEALCGLALAVAAFAVLTHRGWAWTAATAAHTFALGGVVLGMAALAAGAGSSTELNTPSTTASCWWRSWRSWRCYCHPSEGTRCVAHLGQQ